MIVMLSASGNYRSTYGGGQVYVRQVAAQLVKSGHSVVVLSVRVGDDENHESRDVHENNVIVREVAVNRGELEKSRSAEFDSRILAAARKALGDFGPNVVHAHGWKPAFARVCQEEDVPCVITAHHGGLVCPAGTLLDADDNICQRPVGKHCILCCQRQMPLGTLAGAIAHVMPHRVRVSIGKTLQRLPFVPFVTGALTVPLGVALRLEAIDMIARSKAVLVAPSKAIQAALIRNGISPEWIELVHHGIEPFERLPLPNGLGSRPLRIAYVGRFNRGKGLHVMAAAIGQLKDPASVELHLLGTAHTRSEKRYARRAIRAIPTGCQVLDHGHLDRPDVARVLAECDILLLPSIYLEVFGLVIPEAFSLGRPVIASRCGGPEELVRNDVDGLVVERNNPQALTTAIQSLIDDPSRIAAMAANIRPVRTMKENVLDLERVYRRAIDLVRRGPQTP